MTRADTTPTPGRQGPGRQPGNDAVFSVAGSHPDRRALRNSRSWAKANPRTAAGNQALLISGLLLLGAQPAAAQPESRWSPARARAAGVGRNDIDAGEQRHNPRAQEQATKTLTAKRSRSAQAPGAQPDARWAARIDRYGALAVANATRRTAGTSGYQRSRTGAVPHLRVVPKEAYLSYQPSRKARPRVPLNRLNISRAGVASLSISIFSAARARTAKM
jgi:hypothetical protein